jgi:hypothetical protein
MDSWHATFLGLQHLPREVTGFEIEAFYQFSAEECRLIEQRRRPELKLALALRIGFFADERAPSRSDADRPAAAVVDFTCNRHKIIPKVTRFVRPLKVWSVLGIYCSTRKLQIAIRSISSREISSCRRS